MGQPTARATVKLLSRPTVFDQTHVPAYKPTYKLVHGPTVGPVLKIYKKNIVRFFLACDPWGRKKMIFHTTFKNTVLTSPTFPRIYLAEKIPVQKTILFLNFRKISYFSRGGPDPLGGVKGPRGGVVKSSFS